MAGSLFLRRRISSRWCCQRISSRWSCLTCIPLLRQRIYLWSTTIPTSQTQSPMILWQKYGRIFGILSENWGMTFLSPHIHCSEPQMAFAGVPPQSLRPSMPITNLFWLEAGLELELEAETLHPPRLLLLFSRERLELAWLSAELEDHTHWRADVLIVKTFRGQLWNHALLL